MVDQAEEPRRRYVNAYAVDRRYGGPEEGGWYYDDGTPLASIPVDTDAEEAAARDMINAKFKDAYEQTNRHGRFSVIGGPDLEIYIEESPAVAYPYETPHYE